MKIVRNNTSYSTRELRSLIVAVHNHMKKLEGKSAPNWKNLRIRVLNSRNGSGLCGYAYYYGRGRNGWDVSISLPKRGVSAHGVVWMVYHELMHTYGYRHRQFTNIPRTEIQRLVPEDYTLKPTSSTVSVA